MIIRACSHAKRGMTKFFGFDDDADNESSALKWQERSKMLHSNKVIGGGWFERQSATEHAAYEMVEQRTQAAAVGVTVTDGPPHGTSSVPTSRLRLVEILCLKI